jgi:hypothetical protein
MTAKKKRPAPARPQSIPISDAKAFVSALERQGLIEPGASMPTILKAVGKILDAWLETHESDPALDELLSFTSAHWEWLDDWQQDFVVGLRQRKRMTPQTLSVLRGVVDVVSHRMKRALSEKSSEQWGEGEI